MPRMKRAEYLLTKVEKDVKTKEGAKMKEGVQRTMGVLADPLMCLRLGAGKDKSTLDERVMRRLTAAPAL